MPFYLRKSLRFGPVRVNFSKTGIGVSTGIKGARIGTGPRGTYVHAGRYGVYYRKTLHPARSKRPSHREQFQRSEVSQFNDISSATVNNLVDSSNRDILDQVNRRAKRPILSPIIVALISVVLAVALSSILPVLFGLVLAWLVFYAEKAWRPIELNYHLEHAYEKRFEAIKEALIALGTPERVWQVTAKQSTHDWKRNAGAHMLIQRHPAAIGSLIPPFIRTNVEIYGIALKSLKLFFFPDQVFVFQNRRYGAVPYDSLKVEGSWTRFIEDGAVPIDTEIVDYTWCYVRRDGGPDRRFNNNRKIPVVRYGLLEITSHTGLNLHLHGELPRFSGHLNT